MTDKISSRGATPKGLTAPQKRMWGMVASLQAYMKTYDKQPMYLDYQDKTFIDDMLYGLGRALSKDYEFAGGFDKFKAFLRDYLAAETPRSETVTCPLCVPSDDAIEAEIKRLHPHGHYKETPSGMTGQDLLREMARFVLRGVYPLCSRADTSRSATAGFAEAITASVMNASPAARLEACAPFNAAPQDVAGVKARCDIDAQHPAVAAPLSQSDKPREEIPVCGAHAETWFCERDHLNGGMDAKCIVCAHDFSSRSSVAANEPVAWTSERAIKGGGTGYVPAWEWRTEEFTVPLYASPVSATGANEVTHPLVIAGVTKGSETAPKYQRVFDAVMALTTPDNELSCIPDGPERDELQAAIHEANT